MATFLLSSTIYTMDVNVGDAMVVVKCSGGTLTFDIDITFETVVAGSTATGILSQVHNRQLRILYSRPFAAHFSACMLLHARCQKQN